MSLTTEAVSHCCGCRIPIRTISAVLGNIGRYHCSHLLWMFSDRQLSWRRDCRNLFHLWNWSWILWLKGCIWKEVLIFELQGSLLHSFSSRKLTRNLHLWFLQRWLWCQLLWSPLGCWCRGGRGGRGVQGCRTSGRDLVFFLSARRELRCRFTTLQEVLLPRDRLSSWQPIPLRLFLLLFGLACRLQLLCSSSSYRWEGYRHLSWVGKGRLR